MGIVAKQSVLNTIYNYVGFIFGALNTLFLFTHIFNKTDYGLVTYLATTGNLLWPFLTFGMHNTLVKFYHSYTTQEEKNYFFSWILILPIITILIVFCAYLFFFNEIHGYFENANAVVSPYIWMIFVLGLCAAYFELFFSWAKIHLKSVSGNFIKAIFLRVVISFLLLLVYLNYISVSQFMYAFAFSYLLRAILMGIIAFKIHPFSFQFNRLKNTKELITYSALILIASVVSVYLLDLDKIMIEYFLPIEKLPSYSIAIYIASVIAVPARALLQITTPLTAKFLNEKDYNSLNSLNKKSSTNGLLISGIIAVLILTNTPAIFELVPKNYELFIEIVVCISLVKVFDASLGVTNSILMNSDAYRLVLFFGVAVLVIAFGLNILLIPEYGIIGAAVATLISYAVFNSIKLIFVMKYFNIHPYQLKSLGILLVFSVIGFGFSKFTLNEFHPLISIIIKGSLASILLIFLVLKLRLSSDISEGFTKLIKR